MIVSHRHRFVFLRPRKVAGTSVEVAMSRHCGDDDIITPMGRHQARWDHDAWADLGRPRTGYRRHATVEQVRSRLGDDLWKRYLKFSIVRNPWDLVVSQYHWATRKGAIGRTTWNTARRFWRDPMRVRSNVQTVLANAAQRVFRPEPVPFDFFATRLLRYYGDNGDQYFDRSGALALDFVIRFENLESDYLGLCERMGLPGTGLPSLKSKTRAARRPYSTYYSAKTRERVARAYRRHIEEFGYTFGEG